MFDRSTLPEEQQEQSDSQPELYVIQSPDAKPGVGINPLTLIGAMVVGGAMWVGIFAGLRAIIKAITG